ncbi:MAG TPA: HlyC/CorC family transporter [Candidatus Pullichristensenella excrementipullorum]|nr:HlyC/CorC family transporter [Candidatus Pullichristensenella excrementipullorum]
MAPDPFSSLILIILFMFAGAYLRAAEAAARLIDETALAKDSPAARFVSACDDRFGAPSAAFGLMMLAACACAFSAFFAPLAQWLDGLFHAQLLASLLSGVLLWLLTALLYISVCALLPTYVAAHAPEKTFARTLGLAMFLLALFKPLLLFAKGLASLILKPFHVPVRALGERITKQEIRMMVDIGEEKGEIEADEKQMIENVFEFNNMTAVECMVHRKDVTAIDVEDDPAAILQTIQDSGLSRFPVYEEDVDNILGILTSRDYLLNDCFGRGKTLRELIRPAYFVPESLRADLLFSEMQKRKQHMAIVVDEYGGTSGIVTLEDLLEEIVGNIYDEFDPQADEDIIPLSDTRLRVSGSARLDALGEKLGMELDEDEDCDTLGGLVFSQLSEIPSDGERPVVTCRGLRIAVEQLTDRRVEWAIVEKLPPENEPGAEGAQTVPAK